MAKRGKISSYDLIMRAAKTLFWKYGLRKVTVEELCGKAGVSKMTFYRLFNNKQELALRVIAQEYEAGVRDYRQIMAMEVSYADKVRRVIMMKLEGTRDMSHELLRDIYQLGERELMQALETMKEEMLKLIMDDMRAAQQRGEIRGDVKLEYLLYSLKKLQEQVADDAVLALYDTPQEFVNDAIGMFFYGVMGGRTDA